MAAAKSTKNEMVALTRTPIEISNLVLGPLELTLGRKTSKTLDLTRDLA